MGKRANEQWVASEGIRGAQKASERFPSQSDRREVQEKGLVEPQRKQHLVRSEHGRPSEASTPRKRPPPPPAEHARWQDHTISAPRISRNEWSDQLRATKPILLNLPGEPKNSLAYFSKDGPAWRLCAMLIDKLPKTLWAIAAIVAAANGVAVLRTFT